MDLHNLFGLLGTIGLRRALRLEHTRAHGLTGIIRLATPFCYPPDLPAIPQEQAVMSAMLGD